MLHWVVAAAALAAPGADLSIKVNPPGAPDATSAAVIYVIEVRNDGPTAAHDVRWTIEGSSRTRECQPNAIRTLPAGETWRLFCYLDSIPAGGPGFIAASVSSNSPDPNTSNNASRADFQWIIGPDLAIDIDKGPIDPGLPSGVIVRFYNKSTIGAPGATITLSLPEGASAGPLGEHCAADGASVSCRTGPIPPRSSFTDAFELAIPVIVEATTGSSLFEATIQADVAEANRGNNRATAVMRVHQMVWVRNTRDSGEGSLRAALEEAPPDCAPCKIAFDLGPPPPGGYHTIAPESPLPPATEIVSIDGSTQTRTNGDTNPEGPEVYLDGSRLTAGHGLTLRNGGGVIGLAIGNFPGSGVHVERTTASLPDVPHRISSSFLGLAPDGKTPAPNSRGIVIGRAAGGFEISGNVISANRFSGIFLLGIQTVVRGNVIGLDPTLRIPLGNGGSGIYFGTPVREGALPSASNWARVKNNVIAYNHHFGIAVIQGGAMEIEQNSIHANGQMGIDFGMDGPGGAPVLESATYDPASDTTTITTKSIPFNFGPAPVVYFYSSDAPNGSGFGDGMQLLVASEDYRAKRVTLPGDLRGQWISITATVHAADCCFGTGSRWPNTITTSTEFSNAVQVK